MRASQTYVGCGTGQDVTESGITTGTGNGQVNLAALSAGNYQVVAKSKSGNSFTITKPRRARSRAAAPSPPRAPARARASGSA